MALFDVLFEFSDAQDITGDAQSTDVLDWGEGMEGLNMGVGTPLWLNVSVDTDDFAGGTSLGIEVYSHSAATSIESGTAILTGPVIVQASLTAGAVIYSGALPANADVARYLGIYYQDTGAFSTGAVNAWLSEGPSTNVVSTQVAPSNV